MLPQVGDRSLLRPTPSPDLQEKTLPRSWKESRRHGPTHSCSLERGVPAPFSGLLSLKINEGLLAQEAVHGGRLGPDQQCARPSGHTRGTVKSPKSPLLIEFCLFGPKELRSKHSQGDLPFLITSLE